MHPVETIFSCHHATTLEHRIAATRSFQMHASLPFQIPFATKAKKLAEGGRSTKDGKLFFFFNKQMLKRSWLHTRAIWNQMREKEKIFWKHWCNLNVKVNTKHDIHPHIVRAHAHMSPKRNLHVRQGHVLAFNSPVIPTWFGSCSCTRYTRVLIPDQDFRNHII